MAAIGLGSTRNKAGPCGIEKKDDLYKEQKKESKEWTAAEWQECVSCAIYNVVARGLGRENIREFGIGEHWPLESQLIFSFTVFARFAYFFYSD